MKPELECFDLGHVANAEPLLQMGALKRPLQYSFILGVLGGAPPSAETLGTDGPRPSGARTPGRSSASAGRSGGSSARRWRSGGNVRVGLEDNFYLDAAGTEMAKGNGPLVEKAVRMARDVGREPMSPDEARKALALAPGVVRRALGPRARLPQGTTPTVSAAVYPAETLPLTIGVSSVAPSWNTLSVARLTPARLAALPV